MPKVARVLPRGVGGRQGVRGAPVREGSPRFGKSDRFYPSWGQYRCGHSPTTENGVSDSKFSAKSESPGLRETPAPHRPRKDPSAGDVPPWSSVSRDAETRRAEPCAVGKVVAPRRTTRHHGKRKAQIERFGAALPAHAPPWSTRAAFHPVSGQSKRIKRISRDSPKLF